MESLHSRESVRMQCQHRHQAQKAQAGAQQINKEMETGAIRKDARMGGSKTFASEELLQVGSGCVKGK